MSSDTPLRLTVDGELVALTPDEIAQRDRDAARSPSPTTVTGNQWAFALRDLGLAEAWLSALPKCKASDQWRASLIGRDTPLRADDPLLARIAANAGVDAGGKALVDPAAVFAKALTEPT